MAIRVLINGSEVFDPMIAGLSVDLELENRWTATMRLRNYHAVGQSVSIYDGDEVKLFGGTIDQVDKEQRNPSGEIVYTYLCISWELILDRLPVTKEVFGQTFVADASTDTITSYAHGLTDDQAVRLVTTGTLPGGLATATTYYVRDSGTNSFKLAATVGGSAINITDAGSGTHSFQWRAGDIAEYLVTTYTSGEAMTIGEVQAGAWMGKVACNYDVLGDKLTELAAASNYVRTVDPDIKFYFRARSTEATPFDIADEQTEVLIRNLRYRLTRQDYFNKENRRIAWSAQSPTVEPLSGDGTTTQFWLDKRVEVIESITVDGATLSVGVDGVDTDRDAYYSFAEHSLRFTDAPASGADNIEITYREFTSNVLVLENSGAISERATAEGNTGKYVRNVDDQSNTDGVLAITQGQADVDQYGVINGELTYETYENGIRPGQLQAVALTDLNISADVLITHVQARAKNTEKFLYAITGVTGQRVKALSDFFRGIKGGGGTSVSGTAGSASGAAAGSGVAFWDETVTY